MKIYCYRERLWKSSGAFKLLHCLKKPTCTHLAQSRETKNKESIHFISYDKVCVFFVAVQRTSAANLHTLVEFSFRPNQAEKRLVNDNSELLSVVIPLTDLSFHVTHL